MKSNLILKSDSYKFSHFLQLPQGVTSVFSYIEARKGEPVTFFGLQYIIKEYLTRPFTQDDVNEAEVFCKAHGVPFNKDGFQYILDSHRGLMPLKIKAVPEGLVVPTGNVLVTIESTDPKVAWVVGWAETLLLKLWYPTSVASLSRNCRKLILKALERTSDNPLVEIPFKLHDFGYRGVSSEESAGIGGMAHLVNFMGSDTIEGVRYANHYYHCDMSAFSIPAAEHFTITTWGKDKELDAYRNMLDQFAKSGSLVAIVSDSYDIENAITNLWGRALKQQIIDSGATVIIRPDTGIPHEMVLKCLRLLEEAFGTTLNSKGYKVLNNNVRVIQGDGINYHSLRDILDTVSLNGYSLTNVAFGMGGGLLQQVNRDTFSFAYKCSSITINGVEQDVFKDPIDDKGKTSKKGRLKLVYDGPYTPLGGGYKTVRENEPGDDVLQTVYLDGELVVDQTLAEIRAKAAL